MPPFDDIRCIAFDYTGTLTGPHTDEPECRPIDPRAAQTLHTLQERGYRLILASDTVPERPRDAALAGAGLTEVFHAVIQSHTLGAAKPDPAFFQAVVAASGGLDPHQVMYVGDQLGKDVIAAGAAGLRAALVAPTGSLRHGQRLPAAARRIHHVHDLLALLPESCLR